MGRWCRGTLKESRFQKSSVSKSTRRLQRSRFGIRLWSWRGKFLTTQVKNILFRLFQLRSVWCGILRIRGTWRETRKKRGKEEEKQGCELSSLELKKVLREDYRKRSLLLIAAPRHVKAGKTISVDYDEEFTF